MAKRGITLLDLASPYPGAPTLLPADLAAKLENFAVVEHHATTSPGTFLHQGVIQPISDLGFPALRNWPVEVPGLNTGLPFRLVRPRTAATAGQNLEPGATSAFLDLVVDRIAITVPGLTPALAVSGPAVATHLLPDPKNKTVKIVGSGVVRIDLSGSGDLVRFVDWPDPFDPNAPSGAVVTINVEPASFFIGGSKFGLTIGRLIYDASAQTTPAEIIARGQTPGWQGISIAEATLHLPPETPVVDQLNIGVEDVLLGSPAGLQGEVRIELGRTPIAGGAVEFLQKLQDSEPHLQVNGSNREFTVPLLPDPRLPVAQVRARPTAPASGTTTQPQVVWTLPDRRTVDTSDTGYFDARVGDVLTGTFSEEVDGQRVDDLPTRFTFSQEAPVEQPAKVDALIGGTAVTNVVSLSGSKTALAAVDFQSALPVPDAAGIQWQYGSGTGAQTGKGHDFTITDFQVGTGFLVVTDTKQRTRRIRIDVLAQGPLLVGTGDGVYDASATPVAVRGIEKTYDLTAFHTDGRFAPGPGEATASGTTVTVPDGALAEVTLELGHGADPNDNPPAVAESDARHLQVRFGFDDDHITAWGALVPRTREGTIEATVRKWSQYFPGASFVVVGHCCDLGTDPHNAGLATQRAEAVRPWIDGTTLTRGEQTPATGQLATTQNSDPVDDDGRFVGRLIDTRYTATQRAAWGQSTTYPTREEYRRADIYAVGGSYTPPPGADANGQKNPTKDQETTPDVRRALVPGKDATPAKAPSADPKLPFLVRLVVSWDSPTVTSWADAIPTKAEFTVEWASTNVTTLPKPGGGEDQLNVRPPSQPPGSTSTEVYTLTGKWAYDSRSGETQFSLGIASSGDPKGLAAIDSTFLAVALALAPALLAGIGAAGVDGAAVRMAALAIATGVVATVAKEGEVVINSAEIEHRQRSLTDQTGSRTRVLLDYTAAVGFDIDASGIGSIATDAGYPLKVRYHKVGLEFDDSKDTWDEKFGLVYDDVSFEVADSGRWKLDGPLGQLLQVVGSRAGVGSTWFECDLAFALDLGVVSITGATVRATWGDAGFSAELRGLGLSVEIPGVLKGAGRVVLGDGGAFKAALELEIVAAGAKASGSLSFDPATDFLSIALGLVLPVGIPLASTGLGIFGFLGNFVSNGQRALPSGHDNDPVGREIAWYRAPAVDKYQPQRGQWAVGLGMIVGTMPDQAFTFNATGMFVVAFPDPAVVFGIDAKLVKKPAAEPSSQGNQPTAGLQILGLIAVDDQAVMIGVRGEYTIPKVLKLKLPIDGYFPYPTTNGDAYVRIGSDGVVAENRPGDPVTITLLPDTLNVTAWAYLMIEAKKLHNLGGDSRFSFDGFSIGFGAGFEIRWSAGPIKLVASAKLLVGFGVNPFLLKGGIFVAGELDLVILSVSASGELICTIWDDHGTLKTNLSGKFCGKVSLFFFSISGCVGVEIGDSLSPEAPEPAAPVGKVSLTDRRGFTTAVATTGTPGSEQTVWPDTVPVIEFTHHVDVSLAPGGAFDPGPAPAGPVWSGSSELKYAYQLTDIQLIPDGGTPLTGPLDSGWWLPTHRPGVLDAGDVAVSEAEGAFLGLMAWDPAPWTYWLTDGGAGTDADPAGTVGRLCDPPRPARPNCALGKLGVRTGVDSVRIPTADAGSPPFPSRFDLLGAERAFGRPLEAIAPILAASGATLVPGQVAAGGFGDDVWWLARTTRYGFTERTTEFRGTLAPDLTRPELVLVVCQDHRRRPEGIRAGLTCAHPDYPDGGIVLGGSATLGPVTVESMDGDLVTIGVGNDQSIGFTQGVIAALPTTTGLVEITLHLPGTEAKAIGYDNTGTPVADAATSVGQGLVTLTLAGDGIVKVEVYGGGRRIGLVSICWGAATSQAVVADLPEVRGRLADGSEQAWSPKVLAQTRTDSSLCRLVSYTPSVTDRVWSGVRIREWAGSGKQDAGGVGIVRLCGVTGPAAAQAQANQDFASHLAEVINLHALDGAASHKDLLQPATGYTVLINYRWQGWLKSDGQPTPPTVPDPTKWKDASAPVSLRFRTADHATVTGLPPTELTDERAFDPRSLLRYLIAFQPDTGAAPHLLDDTLLVHLAVDHADQLAGLYSRDLMLRLRRTDPPPGSLATAAHAPDEQLTVTWGPLFDVYRPLGQRRFLGAVREAPCLSEPSLGGTTGEVTADLVPGAWYDLILVAPRTGHPEDEDAVVARTHFQASRYHGVADLLGSLGFTSSGDEWPILAGDALVTAGLPGSGLVVGDAALDAALQGCGLDPWPLPEQARSSVLWWNDGGSWKLAGLLLEAAEPIVRTGRTALDVVAADYGGVALTQRVRNLAGTRVLLAPAGPVAVPAATQLQVTLTKTVTDAAGATTATATLGRRAAIGVPRAVYAEAGA